MLTESKIIAKITISGDGYRIQVFEEEIGSTKFIQEIEVDAIDLDIHIKSQIGKHISDLITEKRVMGMGKCREKL